MTPAQKALYWRLWQRLCKARAWHTLPRQEQDAHRRALHQEAHCPPSSTDFKNRDFDRFLATITAHLNNQNAPGLPRHDTDGQTRRLVWRIRHDATRAGLDEAYIRKIARDLHVLGNWEDLDLDSLENLRNTIHNRARKKLQTTQPTTENPF